MLFLVTAGSTREKIDQVRDWGNIFTGNTGFAIAEALAPLGPVDLLTSNRDHIARSIDPIRATHFTTHADLRNLLETQMASTTYDAIFMSAAVSDYTPTETFAVTAREKNPDGSETWQVHSAQADKVKSHHPAIAVLGTPTEKLIDLFRSRWRHCGLLIKFKLEVGISPEALIQIGQKSRKASGADYLVANTLDMVTGENAGAYLLSESIEEWVPRAGLAQRMKNLIIKP